MRYGDTDECHILSFVISHSFRGLGLGSKMITATFRPAGRQLKVNKIRALVKDSNPASMRTFINAGFQKGDETTVAGYRSQIFDKRI